jgi:death-on-curing protein
VIWKFLDVERVLDLHKRQIDLFGGTAGLRDPGLLESAVMRAEFKAKFDPEASLASIAASLGFGLIKNHAFLDGNKRIGLAAVVTMLKVNGFRLSASTDEKVDVVLRVASSEITESDFAAWVERSIAPLV